MSQCGQVVEGPGSTAYLCFVESNHLGPCAAREFPRSIKKRNEWLEAHLVEAYTPLVSREELAVKPPPLADVVLGFWTVMADHARHRRVFQLNSGEYDDSYSWRLVAIDPATAVLWATDANTATVLVPLLIEDTRLCIFYDSEPDSDTATAIAELLAAYR